MKNNKKRLLSMIGIIAVVLVFAVGYFALKPQTQKGNKNITIEVINSAEESMVYNVNTDAEFLGDAFKDAEGLEIKGEQGQYGLMITSVNGEEAIFEDTGAYWSIKVNGEYGMYGADSQPIADGDKYQLVYTKD